MRSTNACYLLTYCCTLSRWFWIPSRAAANASICAVFSVRSGVQRSPHAHTKRYWTLLRCHEITFSVSGPFRRHPAVHARTSLPYRHSCVGTAQLLHQQKHFDCGWCGRRCTQCCHPASNHSSKPPETPVVLLSGGVLYSSTSEHDRDAL